ncbi:MULTISPECIES: hypothetical protein [unclassified Cupriavidus]|uniref:hypothetical protein n=1 Tax=unclassified Cupriavidus TaxID=2640874 RepID=UPI0010F8ECB2|nr:MULTISPECIES: hypothetical protein [unclassified Cupriavidus]MWL90474.1 hypothetical protein [Cupriavidus sp. SW-Y-13]
MASPRRLLPLAALLVLIPGSMAWAQPQSGASSAAAAISEAVQDGSNPYRPPSAPNPNDKSNASYEDQRRARCDQLLQDINDTSRKRTYKSPGTATTNAQGEAVPKLERDKTLKRLQQSYRDNCS